MQPVTTPVKKRWARLPPGRPLLACPLTERGPLQLASRPVLRKSRMSGARARRKASGGGELGEGVAASSPPRPTPSVPPPQPASTTPASAAADITTAKGSMDRVAPTFLLAIA